MAFRYADGAVFSLRHMDRLDAAFVIFRSVRNRAYYNQLWKCRIDKARNKSRKTAHTAVMDKKKQTQQETEFEDVVSATECTGLMQGMPLDGADKENYGELYDYGPEAGQPLFMWTKTCDEQS